MKKIILYLIVPSLFFGFNLARAEVIINEVQILPTEDRFIELYNSSEQSIDLTGWYIQRKTASGGTYGSLVTKTNFENKIINSKSYFLISRVSSDKTDILIDDLTLTESNSIQIKDSAGNVVDKISYGNSNECISPCPVNPSDGNSLQLINGLWRVSLPTPGAQNAEVLAQNSDSDSNNSNQNVSSGTASTTATEIYKIKTKIITELPIFVGVPAEFNVVTTGYNNEILRYGQYFWNFGDGDSKEVKASNPEKLTHTFFYEGEYVVALEYFQNYFSDNPDAEDKIIIKVVKPNIFVSNVGDEKDFFIEISNNTDYDADLSKWILASNTKSFVFPKNMIIQSKKKIILSPKITGFDISDKNSLKLLNSQWETVFDYTSLSNPVKISTKTLTTSRLYLEKNNKNTEDINNLLKTEMPAENLEATALKGIAENTDSENNFNYELLSLFILLSVGAGAVYYVRTHNRKIIGEGVGSDFEILDE